MRYPELKISYKRLPLIDSITCSDDIYNFFMKHWDKGTLEMQEQVYVMCMDSNNGVICYKRIGIGNDRESIIDVKLAMACAIGCYCSKIVVAHNHPSGSLRPSQDDIEATYKLNKATLVMDIVLMDHLIITTRGYYSFYNDGLLV